MKKFITFLLCTVAFSLSAQSLDSLQTTIKPIQNFNSQFDGYQYASQFKNVINPKGKVALSSYNKTTGLNDVYFPQNDSLVYVKSNLVLENEYRGSKIDSFNPYGAPDVKYGLVLGVVYSFIKNK